MHKGLHGAGPGVVWQRRVVVGVVGRYTHDEVTGPFFVGHKGIAALVDIRFQIGDCARCDITRSVAGQNLHTVVSGGAGCRVVLRLVPLNLVTAIDVIICVRGLAGLDVDFSRLGGLGAVQHVLIVVLDDLVGDVGNINVVFVLAVRGFAELQHHSRSLVAGIGIIENVGFVTVGLDVGRVCFGIPIRRNSASHPPQTVRCTVPILCQSGQECNIRIGRFISDVIAYVQTVCFYFFRGLVPICLIVGRVTSSIIRFLPVTCCTVWFCRGQFTLILFIEALACIFIFGFFNIIVAVAGDILATQAQIGNRIPICTNRGKAVCDIGCFFRPRAITAAADNSDFSATRKVCIKVSAAVNIYRNIFNFPLVVRADPCQNADCLRFCLDCAAIDAVDDVQRHNIGDLLHLDFTDNARTVICAV